MALDSLRDGFVRMCFDPSLNVYLGKCRVLFEGQMLDSGTAADGKLIQIPSMRGVDKLFGEGSVIAEGLRTGFSCCTNNAMEFYALPHKDASVGATVKAVYEIAFEQNILYDGRIDFYLGDGRWNTSTLIVAGMKDDDVAAAIAADLQVDPTLPYDVIQGDPLAGSGEGNIVRLTAKNAGTVGNNLQIIPNWHERRDYMPGNDEDPTKPFTITVTQTVVGENVAFTPPDYSAELGECCYCCIGMLYDTTAWQDAMIAYIAEAWACDKPQCFGHGYTYNTGTLGQILATDTNSAEVSRMAHCTTDPILGWMKVAAYTGLSCCSTVDNPELAVQGPTFGVLTCVTQPESCTQCFTFDEQEQLRASGFVVTTPLVGGTGALTSPIVTNDITNNRYDIEGRENATWHDVSSRRLAAKTADEFAQELQTYNGLGLFTKNTTVRPGVRGTNPRMILGGIRAWAKDNVGILFSEFENIDEDIVVLTDFQVAPKCQGIPGKMHVNMVYRPPVRITQFQVNMQPKLLDNC